MLRSALAFRAIQTDSRSRSHPLLLLRYRGNDVERTRYGISTGKRLGPAVARNRVRRRLRTVLRRLASDVAPGWDVLIVARPPASVASQQELDLALAQLLRSAGLVAVHGRPDGRPE